MLNQCQHWLSSSRSIILALCTAWFALITLQNISGINGLEFDMGMDGSRHLSTSTAIIDIKTIDYDPELKIIFDPPNLHSNPTALGVFVQATDPTAKIYYEISDESPTLDSAYCTFNTPYIHVDTPYLASRNRTVTFVAVVTTIDGSTRSLQHTVNYFVEAANRPKSFAFFVPGIETSGYFLRIGLEMEAPARAQTAGGQEYANFSTELGVGTYYTQIRAIHLPSIDPDLNGFEGGLAVNLTNNRHHGIIVPYHNGKHFFGKVVRFDLRNMENVTLCRSKYRMESLDAHGKVVVTGTASRKDACVFVLDLSTIHPFARGFRRAFVGYPYVYLSPGEFNVPVRLNMENFGIDTTVALDLNTVDSGLGGYSGGFTDFTWACFNPLRTFYGPVGGLRSSLPVDANHLRAYYHGKVLCINETGWNHPSQLASQIRTFDTSNMSPELRGFSDAVRVGRYAYFCPFAFDSHSYTGKLVRVYLGLNDIGSQLDRIASEGLPISSIMDVLDLAKVSPVLKGFSSLFTAGQFLYLVPFRNSHEPYNGQRGHGNFIRLNLNDYSLTGVEFLDLANTTRSQIPSFAEIDFRGFSYGFASGKYGVLVPFYNAIFSGKSARLVIFGKETMQSNLQELNLMEDAHIPGTYRGFRGGFVSMWQAVEY